MDTITIGSHQGKSCVDDDDPKMVIDDIFGNSPSCITKSGWCLREGLTHIMTVDNGRMMSIVRKYGVPMIYELTTTSPKRMCRHENSTNVNQSIARDDKDDDDDENLDQLKNQPQNCFQSLCRIVAGQQLAGAAAKTVWNRLQETTQHDLTPATILKLASQGMELYLQKPAGLSRAKARSIVALAEAFQEQRNDDDDDEVDDDDKDHEIRLNDSFLTSADDVVVRDALLRVKGIGPWSCDMFMMFYLERPNILPVGDLGVRKGIAKFFQLRGKAKDGSLCPKKDLPLMEKILLPYQPYQSLVTYYMWQVADTKDFYKDDLSGTKVKKRKHNSSSTGVASDAATAVASSTPKKTRTRSKTIMRHVTP